MSVEIESIIEQSLVVALPEYRKTPRPLLQLGIVAALDAHADDIPENYSTLPTSERMNIIKGYVSSSTVAADRILVLFDFCKNKGIAIDFDYPDNNNPISTRQQDYYPTLLKPTPDLSDPNTPLQTVFVEDPDEASHAYDSDSPTQDLTLRIQNLPNFLRKYRKLEAKQREKKTPWGDAFYITGTLFNATPVDILLGEHYLDKVEAESNDERLTERKNWKKLCRVEELKESLYWKYAPSEGPYESPHELHFAFSARRPPTDKDALPSVRFGLSDEKTATVYAIQMPNVLGMSEGSISGHRERHIKAQAYVSSELKNVIRHFRSEASLVLGELPMSLLEEKSDRETVFDFLSYLKDYFNTGMSFRDVGTYAERKSMDIQATASDIDPDFMSYLTNLVHEAESSFGLQIVELAGDTFTKRRERMRRLNPIMRGKKESTYAPPGGVISFSSFCILAHSQNVRRIEIPLYIPLRQHEEDAIDERMLKQTTAIILRTVEEIDGIEIAKYPDDDGVFHLTLDEKLSSSMPVIRDLLQSL
jgi:hypothetical protein